MSAGVAVAVRTEVHVCPAPPQGHQTPEGLLNFWVDSILRGHLDDVCACFCARATVEPTFSSQKREGLEQIRAYKKDHLIDRGIYVEVTDLKLDWVSQDVVTAYARTVWVRGDERHAGRATLVLVRNAMHGWLIRMLHSSLNPA